MSLVENVTETELLYSFDELKYLNNLVIKRKYKFFQIFTENDGKSTQLYNISQKCSFKTSLDLFITDLYAQNILNLRHQCKWSFKAQKISITSQGVLLGYISRTFEWFNFKYIITDSKGITVFIIHGPKLLKSSYQVCDADGATLVGKVKDVRKFFKQQYEVYFKPEINCINKALILASSVVIIDEIEHRRNKNENKTK